MELANIKNLNDLPLNDGVKVIFNPESEFNNSIINPESDVSKPPTVLTIDGCTVMTSGNFSATIGKAKSKKTFQSVAMLAALISDREILGKIKGHLSNDQLVIWFDTEMSGYHLTRMAKRCIALAGVFQPNNIIIIGLRKYNPSERVQIITWALYHFKNIGFVLIDGIRDLLSKGINDEEEATTITSLLLKWTAELNIHISVVLHQNKGDLNARGHIGTEIINKAETVISVNKHPDNSEISIVQPEFCRDREFEPYAFMIDENSLPCTSDVPMKKEANKTPRPDQIPDEQFFKVLNVIFKRNSKYKYTELWQNIKLEFGKLDIAFGDNKAKDFLTYAINEDWITSNNKSYEYNRAIF
jgi:hypothetical protein